MKRLFVLLGFVFCFGSLISQSIHFNYTDGSSSEYELEDVRKITFEGDVMQLHLNDGSQYNWNVSTIGHYQYEENSPNTNIEQILGLVNDLEVKVYPNPTNNLLHVYYNLPFADFIQIELYDLRGRILFNKVIGKKDMGKHFDEVSLEKLNKGNYLIKIVGENNTITKRIIKN